MEQSEDQPVSTGLVGALEPKPVAEPHPVLIAGLADDVTVKVQEINQPALVAAAQQAQAAETPAQNFSKDVLEQAENDNLARDFIAKMNAARAPEPQAYVPPPIPERIAEQTRLEMEAGRKRVSEFEEIHRTRPQVRPVADPTQGSSVAVFRPDDYVPDQRKGQGAQHVITSRAL